MKKSWLLLFLFPFQFISAQSYQDEALMYSRSSIQGTARTVGSAGAYGSVGADLGSLSVNPAGAGLYRSTDFSITPALQVNASNATFNGNVTDASAARAYISQAGFAFTKILKKPDSENDFSFNPNRLNSFTFAVNYQRQNMFNHIENFSGNNNTNSGISAYTDYLNATHLPFTTDNYPIEMLMAYNENLISYDSMSGAYRSNVPAPISQSGNIRSKGATDQIDLTFGGNVNDRFYFGFGLGIVILSYQSNAQISEGVAGSVSGFQNYTFTTSLNEIGLGVNAKFGMIYRPVNWMRIGATYQMPTYYALTENYSANMVANYDTGYYTLDAGSQPFKYKLRTPMKGIASASFFLKDHGFFSVDYEFLNYGSSRFNFGSGYQSFTDEVNASEKQTYGFGHTVRAGFEGAYKSLRVRCGYSFSSTPYKKDQFTKGYSETRNSASIGIGYRGQRFYADFAYLFGIEKDDDAPYADFEVKNANLTHTLLLTLGWKISRDNTARTKKVNRAQPSF